MDSQSFPLEIPGFPEISGNGAYSAQSVYSQNDVEDIIAYAAEVHGVSFHVALNARTDYSSAGLMFWLKSIRLDTPPSSQNLILSTLLVLRLLPGPNSRMVRTFLFLLLRNTNVFSEPPAGQLRFTEAATVNFTTSLLTAAAKLFPSKYFSTGGDELNEACYAQDPETQKTLNSTGESLEQYLSNFTQATQGALAQEGKTPVVWEEMVLAHNVTLANNTIVM